MILIKIKPDSVKKNPNAGRTLSYIQTGPTEITFEYRSKDPLPTWLKDGENFHLLEWGAEWGEHYSRGVIINPNDTALLDKLLLAKGFTVEHERNIQPIHHLPERSHTYEYEPTLCQCSECKEQILHTNILTEEIFDFEEVDKCPVCGETNTFDERRYQSITEYLADEKR